VIGSSYGIIIQFKHKNTPPKLRAAFAYLKLKGEAVLAFTKMVVRFN
jgi:hypothetical protein